MRISFDLDDTLIPENPNDFSAEKRNLAQKLFLIEKIRKGAKFIFRDLRRKGHKVGIYTTSYRSRLKIKIQFLSYGISTDFIINETQNRNELKKRNINSSKYPPAFGIDIHIDDSYGVEIEGKKLKFKTIIVSKTDKGWIEEIRKTCN